MPERYASHSVYNIDTTCTIPNSPPVTLFLAAVDKISKQPTAEITEVFHHNEPDI
jgi:hypothetical protein